MGRGPSGFARPRRVASARGRRAPVASALALGLLLGWSPGVAGAPGEADPIAALPAPSDGSARCAEQLQAARFREGALELPARALAGPCGPLVLGKVLFHDPRLAPATRRACASCHPLDRGGTDGPTGLPGAPEIDTPTIFNAAHNFRFGWDGKSPTLEASIDRALSNGHVPAASGEEPLAALAADPAYPAAFRQVYGALSFAAVRDALAAFIRYLVPRGSRFDRYLGGERDVLSPAEIEGYRLFRVYGCASCHQGRNVGGNMFARFGVVEDPFRDRPNITKVDLGRFNVTGRDRDRHVFRVPSLRNVVRTAPYFHDGSAETLADAIQVMASCQLGRTTSHADVEHIIAFLGTLTGSVPPEVLP